MRFVLAAAVAWIATVSAQTGPPLGPPASVQVPAVPVPPGVDPARLVMEERLRQLQRRERFEDLDTRTRLEVLTNIVGLCIDLGRDCPTEEAKLADAEKELGKEEAQATRQERVKQRVNQLNRRALEALVASPPEWLQARQAANAALRLDPKNAEAARLKARAEKGLRDALVYRSVLGVLAGGAALGALVVAWRAFRKGGAIRPRQLDMIEGPSPGETFKLDKETVSVGALAAEADWVIPDPARRISRRHCEITKSGKHYFLTDCSSNGTWINDKPVPKGEPVLLRKGDRIALAEDVVLKFS